MWKAVFQKSPGRLKAIKEYTVINREFSGAFLAEERPNFDYIMGFAKSIAHLPWGREGFGVRRVDPAWLRLGVKGVANAAAEIIISSDEAEERYTSEEDHFSRSKFRSGHFSEEKKKYLALRRRQAKTETEAWKNAVQEYRDLMHDMCSKKLAPSLPYMKMLFLGWFEPLRDAIANEQHVLQESEKFAAIDGAEFRDCMLQLPPEMMAVITMHKLVGILMTCGEGSRSSGYAAPGGGARLVNTAMHIGEAVENEVMIHKFLEKTKKKPKKSKAVNGEEQEIVTKEHELLRKQVTNMMKMQKARQVTWMLKKEEDSQPWDSTMHAKVGSRLLELLLKTAFIQPPTDQSTEGPQDIRPAFKHTMRSVLMGNTRRNVGVIECDPLVRRGLEKTARHVVMPYMPMLVTPRPWRGYDMGGYIFLPSSVMRVHGAKQQREAIKNVPTKQIKEVYKALNVLGLTKWRVNMRVLHVIDTIWAEGGRLADLVDREDMPLPEKPDTEEETEIKRWKWNLKRAKKTNVERHSRRCDIELKLSVARNMKNEEGFYYPHNLDFRGRAYPMHPHLNHLGSDMCRGILEFAEGRPLGNRGIYWLKVHLANLFGGGVNKLSYDGRQAFIEDNIDNIIDSAEKPLEGKRWWLGAEDPFQCLSACMYLSDALKSSCPESLVCHMPVHQDGSCNGLQHYAALGRDKLGAEAVNLISGDKPADVYSSIAERVDEIMRKDAMENPAKNRNTMNARLLLGQVDRKLVKQTVMTSVYGVTFVGARNQISNRLKERGFADDTALYNACNYAAKVTLTALGDLFNGARSIMTWLGDCAKVIASENETVRWITPLGLPVVQPYRKPARHLVRTSLQTLVVQKESDKVMINRQKSAFPPNFVHSLDGSHMMMTAIACNAAGLTFAGVHDSYWTHACDVDKMNRILRENFVELYSKPILEDLLESFETRFPNLGFPPLPDRSDFDLNEVLNSPYFFN
ncbi:hypothetical protein SUGI_0579240 [Cryptomeria japonica]|uniref:DNA-directed RNA polymerase 1B, mitochondrial n=1 Tax=Cryptomeria japonica TaxID=3369 RepID=UPI002414AC78|nr:DNA-directed RNA polymerase 1B, mitochondrial [Cryptomeria japonica]GLJ29375.1 hypothetical protein SUGI_0579240 [Cryptomeria japonica]